MENVIHDRFASFWACSALFEIMFSTFWGVFSTFGFVHFRALARRPTSISYILFCRHDSFGSIRRVDRARNRCTAPRGRDLDSQRWSSCVITVRFFTILHRYLLLSLMFVYALWISLFTSVASAAFSFVQHFVQHCSAFFFSDRLRARCAERFGYNLVIV